MKHFIFLILISATIAGSCLGALGDLSLSQDGNKIIWPSLTSGILIDDSLLSVYVGRFPFNLTSAGVAVFGFQSGEFNQGDFLSAYGATAASKNIGVNNSMFGFGAGANNEGDQNSAFGMQSFDAFTEDSGNAKVVATVDPNDNRVSVTAGGGHGFGANGTFRILRATSTEDLPSGLSPQPEMWEIISSTVLEVISDSFSDEGSGTITLTPKVIYSNSTAIGFNAEPTASNQVMVGNTNVTEIVLISDTTIGNGDTNPVGEVTSPANSRRAQAGSFPIPDGTIGEADRRVYAHFPGTNTSGGTGLDYTLTFDGETNDGIITWREDEDYFEFDKPLKSKGRLVETTRITSSPYTVLAADEDVFVDTDGEAITINLPAGVDGTRYRVINTGSSGNDITLAPNGAELLTGTNASRTLSDSSVIILTYETTEGWW